MYALILAGGKGERLRPLTEARPKPMVEVLGRPLISYQVEWLKYYGVTDVVVLAGYHWEVIKEHLGDGSGQGVRVHYSVEETPLGRGGAIRRGLGCVPAAEKLVIVTNGDVLSTEDLGAIIQRHRELNCLATVMLVPLASPYGIVELDSKGRIATFREKPQLPYWINAGVYVLNREVEELLPPQGDHEDTTFPHLAAEGKISGYPSRAPWKSVDSFKDLREAEEVVRALLAGIRLGQGTSP